MRYSEDKRKEIIDFYRKVNSFKIVKEKYGVGRDTILCWIDPEFHKKQKMYVLGKLALRRNNPEWVLKQKEYHIKYQKENKEKYKTNHNKWWDKNKHLYQKGSERYQRKLESEARWRANSYTPEMKQQYYSKQKRLYHTDPAFRLATMARRQAARVAKLIQQNKNCSSFNLLGCDSLTFKQHIESQFQPGMSWENYGRGVDQWCIDHIIPLAASKSDIDIQFKLCHYTNTRPLWVRDNLSKGSTYTQEELDKYISNYNNLYEKS